MAVPMLQEDIEKLSGEYRAIIKPHGSDQKIAAKLFILNYHIRHNSPNLNVKYVKNKEKYIFRMILLDEFNK